MKSSKIFAVIILSVLLSVLAAAAFMHFIIASSSGAEESSSIISSSEDIETPEVSIFEAFPDEENPVPDIPESDDSAPAAEVPEYSEYSTDEEGNITNMPNDISEFEYTLKDDICKLTRLKSTGSGKTIIVPSTVTIDDVTYTVTLGEAAFAYKEIVSLILPEILTPL